MLSYWAERYGLNRNQGKDQLSIYLSLTFPLKKETTKKNGKNQINGFSRKTVLIAEDDDTNFLFLNTVLDPYQY